MKHLLSILIFTSLSFLASAQAFLVHDLLPGTAAGNPHLKYVFNNKLIFWAWKGGPNYELYSYHHNDTAIKLEYDYANGSSGDPQTRNPMVEVNGELYFGALCDTLGYELRMWDGVNPPVLVKDIAPGSEHSMPVNFVAYNNKVYFVARKVFRGDELWMHDPLTNTTKQLSDTDPLAVSQAPPKDVIVFKGKIYFTANSLIYLYDPVQDTVYQAKNFDNTSGGTDPMMLSACYDNIYYFATSPDYGYEMYMYDGDNPPKRVTDIYPGKNSSIPGIYTSFQSLKYIAGYKGAVYFTAYDGLTSKLYKFDPSKDPGTGNPVMVYDLHDASSTELFEFDGKLYFNGSDITHGIELWMYDGVNNPAMVADINPGSVDGVPRFFAVYNNELYFTANSITTGYELYKLGSGAHIENISKVKVAKVYPVPATEMVNFEIELKNTFDITIRLVDITGREVYNSGKKTAGNGTTNLQVDISQLAASNYYYSITTTVGVTIASGKMIKQ